MPCAEDYEVLVRASLKLRERTLHVDTTDAVVWVIWSNIVRAGSSTDIVLLSGVRRVPNLVSLVQFLDSLHLHGVAVIVVQQSIDASIVRQTTGESVKGSVFLDQDDNILDLALPVSFVPDCSWRSNGKARQGCHGCEFEANHFTCFWILKPQLSQERPLRLHLQLYTPRCDQAQEPRLKLGTTMVHVSPTIGQDMQKGGA